MCNYPACLLHARGSPWKPHTPRLHMAALPWCMQLLDILRFNGLRPVQHTSLQQRVSWRPTIRKMSPVLRPSLNSYRPPANFNVDQYDSDLSAVLTVLTRAQRKCAESRRMAGCTWISGSILPSSLPVPSSCIDTNLHSHRYHARCAVDHSLISAAASVQRRALRARSQTDCSTVPGSGASESAGRRQQRLRQERQAEEGKEDHKLKTKRGQVRLIIAAAVSALGAAGLVGASMLPCAACACPRSREWICQSRERWSFEQLMLCWDDVFRAACEVRSCLPFVL